MRKPTDNCLLCQEKKATKKNSHIAPKFLTKGILGSEGPRQGFLLNTSQPERKPRKTQDTAKESYLFCPGCEEFFEFLETYIAEHIHKRILVDRFKDDFEYSTNSGGIQYAVSKKSSLLISRLFILSIFWRCSITSTPPFNAFKTKHEDCLRTILERHRTKNLSELINASSDDELNDLPLVLLRLSKENDQTANFLYSVEQEDGALGLILNEYLSFISIEETNSTKGFGELTNIGSENLKIILLPDEIWNEIKETMITKVKNASWKVAAKKGITPYLGDK